MFITIQYNTYSKLAHFMNWDNSLNLHLFSKASYVHGEIQCVCYILFKDAHAPFIDSILTDG